MSGRLAVVGRWVGGTILASAILAAPVAAQDVPPLQVTLVEFYSVVRTGVEAAEQPLSEGGTIPFKVGDSCFGWKIEFQKLAEDEYLTITETLVYPEPFVGIDGFGEEYSVDDPTQYLDVYVPGANGFTSGEVCFAKGQPTGPYKLVLEYDGRVLGQRNFNVQR